MEPPECPVCLQTYDSASTVPRVLACGHSTCQDCLAQIPRPLSSHVIRCPSCTQIVKFPYPQGPSALPKNIDLLRYSLVQDSDHENRKPSSAKSQNSKQIDPRNGVLPRVWSDELYSMWKDWILPEDIVSLGHSDQEVSLSSVLQSRIHRASSSSSSSFYLSSSSLLLCRLKEDQLVSLVRIGCSNLNESVLQYSYVAKVMSVLNGMVETQRAELGSILRLSMKRLRVSQIYGLWFSGVKGFLYLVCEKKNSNSCLSQFYASSLEASEQNENALGNTDVHIISHFSMISREICESLLDLHSEGLVCGGLSVSCFYFDDFGHVYLDLSEVLIMARKLRKCISMAFSNTKVIDEVVALELISNLSETGAYVSPELLSELLQKEGVLLADTSPSMVVSSTADVWSLACVLLRLITGEKFVVENFSYLKCHVVEKGELSSDCKVLYMDWVAKIATTLEALADEKFTALGQVLCPCLDSDPGKRPLLHDLWKSTEYMCSGHSFFASSTFAQKEKIDCCLILGELCSIKDELKTGSGMFRSQRESDTGAKFSHECLYLLGHHDCITGLSVGGQFLFSSSFDKTISVWSLQDLTLVHTYRGHKHKVMAVTFANEEKPVCISGDSEGGIFLWDVSLPFADEPLKKWYEEKDWRYSGIHALAVSGGYLYTGSGDRLIKAWSLLDYTLSGTMEGHKSAVSTLAVSDAVLYSGSWDGTVRLWSLHDHTPLTVFGDQVSGTVPSVFSLFVDKHTVVVAYENGSIKIWMNDMPQGSTQVHNGAIFAVGMKNNLLITGGWDKTIKLQEIKGHESQIDFREVGSISCDSVVTKVLHAGGKLFVGCANKVIKVYRLEC